MWADLYVVHRSCMFRQTSYQAWRYGIFIRYCHTRNSSLTKKSTERSMWANPYHMTGEYSNTLTFKHFLKLVDIQTACCFFLYMDSIFIFNKKKISGHFISNSGRQSIQTPNNLFCVKYVAVLELHVEADLMSGMTLETRVIMPSTWTSRSTSLGSRSRIARFSTKLYGLTLMSTLSSSTAWLPPDAGAASICAQRTQWLRYPN